MSSLRAWLHLRKRERPQPALRTTEPALHANTKAVPSVFHLMTTFSRNLGQLPHPATFHCSPLSDVTCTGRTELRVKHIPGKIQHIKGLPKEQGTVDDRDPLLGLLMASLCRVLHFHACVPYSPIFPHRYLRNSAHSYQLVVLKQILALISLRSCRQM